MTATAPLLVPPLHDPTATEAVARVTAGERDGRLWVSVLERVKAGQERRPHVLVQLLIEIAESIG